jgi:DNA primase
MLCTLPAPHGALFVWLETQLHEHGPLTWNALHPATAAQPFEDLALHLMSDTALPPTQGEESLLELQAVLLSLTIDRIDADMKQMAQAPADEAFGQRFRAMDERRKELDARRAILVKQMLEKV